MNRLDTFTASTTLVVESCCECGMLFAMPEDFQQNRLDNRHARDNGFFCPRGHAQHYTGKTEAQILREQLEEEQREVIWQRSLRQRAEARTEDEKRSKAAIKGHLTRMRNRVAAGACPVSGCKRHFTALQRHLGDVHPGWLEEHDLTLAALEAPNG